MHVVIPCPLEIDKKINILHILHSNLVIDLHFKCEGQLTSMTYVVLVSTGEVRGLVEINIHMSTPIHNLWSQNTQAIM